MHYRQLNQLLGNIDIYLLDQILKGRFTSEMKILDAGCGEGRNLIYFLNNNFEVFGLDKDESAIKMLHFVARSISPTYNINRFFTSTVEKTPFENDTFDAIVSSAVLHFANNEAHFWEMFNEMWRILKSDGLLFIRMAALMGIDASAQPVGEGIFRIPDGSLRFLLTDKLIEQMSQNHTIQWVEPKKFVLVDQQRTMASLVLRKK